MDTFCLLMANRIETYEEVHTEVGDVRKGYLFI